MHLHIIIFEKERNDIMYPLKLKPIYDKTIWAKDNLTKLRGIKETGFGTIWEVSAHPYSKNEILNGEYAGKTLWDLLEDNPKAILGEIPRSKMVRLAFLDAKDDLSIQVHPFDEYAHKHENDEGKTESWYILKAEEGATLVAGTTIADADVLKKAVEDNTVEKYVRKIPVQEGDFVCIDAGMLHALGKGIVALEIGQNSNVTYRFYDYDRRDANGNPRELHIKKSFDVADFTLECKKISNPFENVNMNVEKQLVDRDEFSVKLIDICEEYVLPQDGKRFFTISNMKQDAKIEWDGQEVDFAYTESIFIPADCSKVTVKGKTRILLSFVK